MTTLKERIAKRETSGRTGVHGTYLVPLNAGSSAHVTCETVAPQVPSGELPFPAGKHDRDLTESSILVNAGAGNCTVETFLRKKVLHSREWNPEMPTIIRAKCVDGWMRWKCKSQTTTVKILKFLAERISLIEEVRIFNEGGQEPVPPKMKEKRDYTPRRYYEDAVR